MYADIFKIVMLSNSIFIVLISLYLIFSRKNEPSEYTENFSKKYILRPNKKVNKI